MSEKATLLYYQVAEYFGGILKNNLPERKVTNFLQILGANDNPAEGSRLSNQKAGV